MLEYKINHVVRYKHLLLKVCKGFDCSKCFFGFVTEDDGFICDSPLGLCSGKYRSDNSDVYFKKIGEYD